MRSVELTALRKLELRQVEKPCVQHGEDILLRVLSVGVCGSDVHYFSNGGIGSQVVRYPFRVGHEFSARVEAVGPSVIGLEAGNLVAVDPAISCFRCDQCQGGRPHTCRNLSFLGCPGQMEGCLCDYIVMPAHCCYKVPDSMDPDVATLIEPLSIGSYAVRRSGRIEGSTVAVLGCGPIGLSVLMAALDAGVERVYMTDPVPERRGMAMAMGAFHAETPFNPLSANGDGRDSPDFDVVFECCGRQEALNQAVEILKPGGRLMIVGIPEEDRVSFSIDTLRRHELELINVRRQNDAMHAAIRLAENNLNRVRLMITHPAKPEESQELFETAEAYRDGIVKGVVQFAGV